SRVLGFGLPGNLLAGVSGSSSDWGHPSYYSWPVDPQFTIHCTESWGRCQVEGMRIRIPDAARPAGGGDGHMAVIDQADGWEYDFWQCSASPGVAAGSRSLGEIASRCAETASAA